MNVNTLDQYAEKVIGFIELKRGFFESKKSYEKRVNEKKAMLYSAMENVAKSYHKIAVQNLVILIDHKCRDVKGKLTKKLNYTEIFKISETVKFKP